MNKRLYIYLFLFALTLIGITANYNLHVVALNIPSIEKRDLRVLTWNVHCPKGTDSICQTRIAELIIHEDADFIQLNEFYQDSCAILDDILKKHYPYTEENQSHQRCGDIFYSRTPMSNSGHVIVPVVGNYIQTLKATIPVKEDSVQLFGCHMASNGGIEGDVKSLYERYQEVQQKRCHQASWTKYHIEQAVHPVIVMGDMNDFSFSAPLDTLKSCGIKDAWWNGGNGYGATYHDGWIRLRIDYILYNEKLKVLQTRVVETDLSDHNPIIADFKLK